MSFLPATRRSFLRTAPIVGAAGVLAWTGHAQDAKAPAPASDTGAEFITTEAQGAIDNGLAFLARSQAGDGSFPDRFSGPSVGVTSLAGLALMGAGYQPGRGRFGRTVTRAVDYLLAVGGAGQGYIGGSDGFGGRF